MEFLSKGESVIPMNEKNCQLFLGISQKEFCKLHDMGITPEPFTLIGHLINKKIPLPKTDSKTQPTATL